MSRPFKSLPYIDECRALIAAIIERAMGDFWTLQHSTAPIEQYYYQTACEFLFSDDYTIDYGGEEKTLRDLLDIFDIDIQAFREGVVRGKDRRIKGARLKRIVYDEE
jgi:hypothetical protein